VFCEELMELPLSMRKRFNAVMWGSFVMNDPVFDSPVSLTDEDRAKINSRARSELLQLVFAQAAIGIVVVVIVLLGWGKAAALSAFAGACCYFLPNLLFALRLLLASHRPGGSGPMLFIVGEMMKIGATLGLLWLVAHVGGDQVQWLAVLAGLVAVLKGYVLMLAFGGSRLRLKV
jgi:ATP synthase protein I